ncbi:hypothetical protein CTI12_AA060720 [Artemisia annua]|uniref:Replication factor A C-terminal domain-containing protein n=1 Tax=Artemisia annua TaxID=35608 RepID=A0A2U1Q8L8_ARTAN|nr:hypothetical protein CTI12_AA060720 [Artemisia annua]
MEQNITALCDIDPMLDDIKILARCISIWKSHPKGKPNEVRRNVVLENVDGVQVQCCFFDAWADKFTKYADNRDTLGHVVMILQLAKVNYFNGQLSIRPALFSTKIYINDKIPEIEAFRERYQQIPGYDPKKHIINIFSPAKKIIGKDEFLEGAVKKMVGNIRDSDRACYAIVYAKVHKIHRENGWAYLACKRCGSSAKEIQGTKPSASGSKYKKPQTWKCNKHDEITAVGMRFKVIVRVIDETGSASLLLFDDFVHKLCGVTCQELINQYGEAHEDYFPAELNVMVGKKLLFRFHYSDWNITNNDHIYQVKMISDEDIIISAFKSDFIIEEPITAEKLNEEDYLKNSEMETPVLAVSKASKFSSGDTIPFNIESTPPSGSGNKDAGLDTGSSGSGKHDIIDLDQYDDSAQEAKRQKMLEDGILAEVKIEKED